MKKTTLLSLALFMLFVNNVWSQDNQNKIIPPSPTAASLGEFGSIPIGYYTGTPDVSIPLYEIKTSNLSVPITLSYQSTGLRVAQDASWVGLGWSLSAGGLITRVVRGNDDFDSLGYYYNEALPPSDGANRYLYGDIPFPASAPPGSPAYNDGQYFRGLKEGYKDGEPDIFSYNFGGNSGTFVIDKEIKGSGIFSFKSNNLKFETNHYGQWFKVTTADGTEYFFGSKETSYTKSNNDLPKNYDLSTIVGMSLFTGGSANATSSWYLDSITSPNGDKIEFSYTTGESLSLIRENHKRYLSDPDSAFFWPSAYQAPLVERHYYDSFSRQVISDVILKKITFNNGYVDFETSIRDDIEKSMSTNPTPPQKLSKIKVHDSTGKVIKDINLLHSYFISNDVSIFSTPYSAKRLKLDGIQIDDLNNNYSFDYNNPTGLPHKYSKQYDEWGFYSTSFLASGDILDFPEMRSDYTGDAVTTGVLKSITYPTKGKTEFEYEPHTVKNIRRSEIQDIPVSAIVSYIDYGNAPDDYIEQPIQPFVITDAPSGKLVKLKYKSDVNVNNYPNSKAVLKKSNGIILATFYAGDESTLLLPEGDYILEVINIENGHYGDLTATISTEILLSTKGNGIRINNIANKDFNNNLVGFKKFIYTDDGTETGTTSGLLLVRPEFEYSKNITLVGEVNYCSADYYVKSSNSLAPYGFHSPPNVVGYDKVTVQEGINNKISSTTYEYYNKEFDYYDHYGVEDNFPEMPRYFDTRNGQLLSVTAKNAQAKTIKETIYNYNLKEQTIVKGIKFYNPPFDFYESIFEYNERVRYYDNFSEWWVTSSVNETIYDADGNNPVFTSTYYDYENPLHKNLTKTTTTNSKGQTIITTNKYPQDLLSGLDETPATTVSNMIAANVIDPVIQTETTVGGNLVQGTINNFKTKTYLDENNVSKNMYLPKNVKVLKGGSATVYDQKIDFVDYGKYGNLTEFKPADGTSTVYLWGYNNQYPVAKIENATIAQAQALITQSILDSPTDENSLRTELQKIRTGLPNAMVTTYTYAPLIGITSVSDPKGDTTYYNYDSFGRLQNVKGKDGNILSENEYHYKN